MHSLNPVTWVVAIRSVDVVEHNSDIDLDHDVEPSVDHSYNDPDIHRRNSADVERMVMRDWSVDIAARHDEVDYISSRTGSKIAAVYHEYIYVHDDHADRRESMGSTLVKIHILISDVQRRHS